MAALNEQERAIMIFSYACGLSHREISEATDMPAGTVKSIIHRAKEKIRTQFEIEDHQYG
jgi:RNA polymerase sigma factor (sigma-70 family)